MKHQISELGTWLKISAISFFVIVGFCVIDLIYMLAILPSGMSLRDLPGFNVLPTELITAMSFLLAFTVFIYGVIAYINYVLLKWGQSGKSYAQTESPSDMDTFLALQRRYFTIVGVCYLVIIGLYVLGFLGLGFSYLRGL